jgi:hypothetical protein
MTNIALEVLKHLFYLYIILNVAYGVWVLQAAMQGKKENDRQ